MAWKNGNRPTKRGGSWNNNQGNNSNQGQNSGGNKKNNSCRKGEKNGVQYITGWNRSKDKGFVSVLVSPYKGSHSVTSKNGNEFTVLMAKIHYHGSGMQDHYPVLYSHKSGAIVLEKHGWLLNPNKGYMVRLQKG